MIAVFFTVWSLKLAVLARYGTDLPYWDQWAKEGELFYAPWFEHHEFWKPVVVPHNEHRIAPTLAMNLGLLRLGGDQWDARVQCAASAALHALLAAALSAWALRRLRPRWGVATALLTILVTAPPIAWENVVGGFQSQFYFLSGFSLLALRGLLGSAAGSPAWWAGLAAVPLACASMGSGMLVAIPVAVIAAIRSFDPRLRHGAVTTLLVATGLGALGWWLRPQAPWHAVFHARSLFESARYALRCLAWPSYEFPLLAALVWPPWLALAAHRLRRPLTSPAADSVELEHRRTQDFVLAGGLWVLLQVAAVSYSRGGGAPLPAPRYGDICALGVVFAFLSAALLSQLWSTTAAWRTVPGRGRILVKGVTVAWLAVVGMAILAQTRATLGGPLPGRKAEFAGFERNVQAFVLTDDYRRFERPDTQLPFPSAEWLARILRQPTLRRLLPASVRPPIPMQSESADSKPAPNPALAHRLVWTLDRPATWRSAPLAPGTGWWKIETLGEIGRPGATLELRSAGDGRLLAGISPSKPAGANWRAAYVRAPREPAILVATLASPARGLGFSEPVEVSDLGFWTWRLCERAGWLAGAACLALLGFGWGCARQPRG